MTVGHGTLVLRRASEPCGIPLSAITELLVLEMGRVEEMIGHRYKFSSCRGKPESFVRVLAC